MLQGVAHGAAGRVGRRRCRFLLAEVVVITGREEKAGLAEFFELDQSLI